MLVLSIRKILSARNLKTIDMVKTRILVAPSYGAIGCIILLIMIVFGCDSTNEPASSKEGVNDSIIEKTTNMEALREYDAFISRWMGTSLEASPKKDLLPEYQWEVNLYAEEDGITNRITIDTNRDGVIEEEWSYVDNKVIRSVLENNERFSYTSEGWESFK